MSKLLAMLGWNLVEVVSAAAGFVAGLFVVALIALVVL